MQGVNSGEYEAAEYYFYDLSNTFVLGSGNSVGKTRPVQQGADKHLLINGVKTILHGVPA